ncbi:DUF2332 domain-containing protein [Streptomyces sp. NBC_01497]|uniref:DUF2332 domain-containing protein n=1 Tax=Streptomyces sp. NBC_01497 TaxID=2903885 RepID=UPI002E330709|nr:DUF2332 domain-containing protein [Streptomyces sp. NBC_01497]
MAASMVQSAPMSADMLTMLTDELEAFGPVAQILANHADSATPLYYLRALAGVRLLTITGRAPELAVHLKSLTARLGDPVYSERTRHLFRRTLLDHPDAIREAMDRPVQQHQPRRAGYLLRGLGMLAAPKVRLLEIGACAGLNLIFDHYRWFGSGWQWGDTSSSVRLTAMGPRPGEIQIVHRAGCDISPRDASNLQDAMILRSFIAEESYVEQLELDDAIALAVHSGVQIDKANAVEWLKEQLSLPVPPGTYTVVWHSLFWWYLSTGDQAAIEEILASAARNMRLARICYEPNAWAAAPRLQVTVFS